jgi:ATP-dependent Clp protease ATP-binding subunit ClpA
MLLGLLRPEMGVPAEVLAGLGVTPERVRAEILATEGKGPKASGGHIPFTPAAKRVLEHSLAESLRLQHKNIGTEHLLLGLVKAEGESAADASGPQPNTGPGASATEILAALGVSTDELVHRTKQRLAESDAEPAGESDGEADGARRANAVEERLSTIEATLAGILERLAALERRRAE